MFRFIAVAALTLSVSSLAWSQLTEGVAAKSAPAAQAATDEEPKFKAIWERISFNQDIGLNSVSCKGPETCWVVGDKSTILHTTDGGKTWQVQLGGDPEATDDDLTRVFFLDARHGWAMTGRGKILGTTDGGTWAELSTVSGTTKGVWFLSPQAGLEIENPSSTTESTLRRTDDSGKTWEELSRCSVDTTVDGLPRKLACMMRTAQFVSPTVGFMGGEAAISMGTKVATFGKTSDGGQTWTMSVIPESSRSITSLHFWSEKDGIAVLDRGEEVYWTADAGGTWTRSVKQRLWPSYYGEGDGKIIVGAGESSQQMAYSFNGGRNFTTRPFPAPASVRAVTFFDGQNGYLVGDHAMAYRYRIVPVEYTSPGMIAAAAP
jgi:photosystem II stability/assembly factor-like uncharacterized protein